MYPEIAPHWQYAVMLALCFLLLRLPGAGKFFRVVNTLFHEAGHALMALLVSGQVERIDLFGDTSGSCTYSARYWFSRFLINIAGYPASSVTAWLMIKWMSEGKTDWVFMLLVTMLALSLIFWVRNQYGVIWSLVNLALFGTLYYLQWEMVTFYFLLFLACLNLVESVWSALVILYLSADSPGSSGDAKNLRQMTHIPAVVWGLVFALQALWFANLAVKDLFGWQVPLPF